MKKLSLTLIAILASLTMLAQSHSTILERISEVEKKTVHEKFFKGFVKHDVGTLTRFEKSGLIITFSFLSNGKINYFSANDIWFAGIGDIDFKEYYIKGNWRNVCFRKSFVIIKEKQQKSYIYRVFPKANFTTYFY